MDIKSDDQREKMKEMQDNLEADRYPLPRYKHIGERSGRRLDGYKKAGGAADYTMDVQLPGMLYMRFQDSPYPHAKITRMDTSRAERLPGVRYVLRYDNPELPERASMGKLPGLMGDLPPLPGTAHFEGEPVGVAVAAETEAIAEEALGLIQVEWEERPFNLDPVKARQADAPLSYPEMYPAGNYWNNGMFNELTLGDVKKGFAKSEKVIEFEFYRRGHTWIGPERPCGVFKWNGDCPEVWVKQQRPHLVKKNLATWYGGVAMNKIQLHCLYQGASFGGWIQVMWNMGPLYCAGFVAKKTGRPVKYVFTRREDFYGESMDEGRYRYKVGFNRDGKILAVEGVSTVANQQWPMFNIMNHFKENTCISNLHGTSESIWINKGPAVPTRCEQLPTTLSMTMVFNRVAAECGLDPTHVALKNDGLEGQGPDHLAEEKKKRGFAGIDSLKECIERGKKAIGWDAKWHQPGAKKLLNGRMHGLAFTWTNEWDDSLGSGEMAIRIERNDGTATILAMGCDNGVDAENTYCRIAADELGIRLDDVHYNPQTDPGFFRMSPDSSTNASVNGWAVRHAARIVKQQILEAAVAPTAKTQRGSYRPAFPDCRPEDLDIADSIIFKKSDPSVRMSLADFVREAGQSGPISTTENAGFRWAFSEPFFAFGYHVQLGSYNPENPRPHFTRQAHFLEIEVDPETGEIFIIKVVNVNDVGKALNPMSCEGQQYGGSVMGISRGKFEEMIYDPATGVMLNGNLIDYKIATILDVEGPIDTILVESGMGYGPYGSVGIGEDIGTVMTGLIGPAVYNAVGVWIYDHPITPDKVLKALGRI
ncbi:MAG TPA: molybdopterin cofactor-binding domain-containing protein [Desulfomonilia bacterium]|nr:molybdopterin cofactor-binding domain-containing protein [Desulfomonilia bacterium]